MKKISDNQKRIISTYIKAHNAEAREQKIYSLKTKDNGEATLCKLCMSLHLNASILFSHALHIDYGEINRAHALSDVAILFSKKFGFKSDWTNNITNLVKLKKEKK